MNGALDTLVSQAYGAKDLVLCGQLLNRGRTTAALVFIPLIIPLLFLNPSGLTSFDLRIPESVLPYLCTLFVSALKETDLLFLSACILISSIN